MSAAAKSVNYQRLKDLVRADIVAGVFPSGSRLRIPALCERYRASAIPVREALQGLSGEGLVIMEPNRGAMVRAVDAAFIEDIYEIRTVLEGFIVRRFVEVASDADIAEVEAILREMESREDAGDMTGRHACDIRFHRMIVTAIGNSEVALIVDRHTNIIDAVMRKFGQSPVRIAQVRKEHQALVDAFKRRDAVAAGQIVSDHFRNAQRDLASLMRSISRRKETP